MASITEFLEARIAEDETTARAAIRSGDGSWHVGAYPDSDGEVFDSREVYGDDLHIYDEGGHDENHAEHISRHDPARVLAECAAKRAIIAEIGDDEWMDSCGCLSTPAAIHTLLSHLAAAYKDHQDYRQEWAL